MIEQSRRQVLASIAGFSVLPSLAAAFPAMGANVESIRFGPSISGRVLASKSVRFAPAFFVCGNSLGSPREDHAAAALAADCAAAGYVAIHLVPTAWRGRAKETLEWLPAAADWLRANQASGRLHARNVFLGGDGAGASGALSWAQTFRAGLQESRLRAVVGINGVYDASAAENAAGVLSQGPSGSTSIVLIADGERGASSLDLGHALARSGSAFEMHLLASSGPGLDGDTQIGEQMRSALQG
jgi:hypothetical protein